MWRAFALFAEERIRAIRGMLVTGGTLDEDFAKGRLGEAICGRAATPDATKHSGLHRTSWVLTTKSYQMNRYGPSRSRNDRRRTHS